MRRLVSGNAEFDATGDWIPVPVLGVRIGLDAIASYVEPDGRVEGRVLADEDVGELVVKGRAVFSGLEVALRESPIANGFGDAGDQRTHTAFALRRADGSVQIFAGHDVGRGHRPIFGSLDVLLLEDHVALGIGDLSEAEFPFDFVVWRDARLSKKAAEGQARGLLDGVRS